MYQWKTSSAIYATSISPVAHLSISQLIRIERHRGSSYAALHSPQHEQTPAELSHSVFDGVQGTFLQDGQDLSAGGIPTTNVKVQPNLVQLQIQDRSPSCGLIHTARNSRLARTHYSPLDPNRSIDRVYRRHASHSAGLLPPNFKDVSKKPLSTQTGSNAAKLPQLVPNKLATGPKAPTKSVKETDNAFREMDHGETVRAWPMSSEERKAEAKRQEEARLLKERKERQAREAEEAALQRHQQEQLRQEAEAIQRAKALALEQKNRALREKWMATFATSVASLERVSVQLNDVRSRIEKLLDKCEAARRALWEEKAKRIEMIFDTIMEKKERYAQLVAKCSQSSTSLCSTIAEFCMAVGEDVHRERYATLVNERSNFLPRYMFAEGDTPHRRAHLCAIFWMYTRLKNFEGEMQSEAHVWRHLHSARIIHALHPEAFAYKPLFAEWYCRTQRFVNDTNTFAADHEFWNAHTEFVKPQLSSRQQRDKNAPDVIAKTTRRNDLAFFLKDGATDISRDLFRLFDRGNFVLGRHAADFKRQQQIALRKPFTLVLEQVRETERLLGSFVLLLVEVNPRRSKIEKFLNDTRMELRLAQASVRSYLNELDLLTYWNWLATERQVPQKRMSFRKISQQTTIQAAPRVDSSTSVFNQNGDPDETWRYTNFRGPHGQPVVVDYCVTYEFAERTAKLFTNKRVIGIDLWGGKRFANVEDAVREGNSAKGCVPMIAIASEERIALFHLASMRFDSYITRLPTLVQILEDPAICKVGENTQAARLRLWTYVGINMDGVVNLNSMYAGSCRSSQKHKILGSHAAPPLYSRPSTIYPPEPQTTMTLSDQLKKHIGQSLRDDTVNPEDLQMERIGSPKLIQLSASRPYAALQLHRILEQRMRTDGYQPSVLSEKWRTSETAELALPPRPANEDDHVSFNKLKEASPASSDGYIPQAIDKGLVVAEHDLGPTNIDPWSDTRDSRLKELATALAKVIQGQAAGIARNTPLTAYVLLTRFGQSCEDIHRILRIQEPADAILELVETTNLPLNETALTLLKAEKESMQGSNPKTRATKWIKKIIASAPALLRMYRRSSQVRTEFEVYAMWHRLEMSVPEIVDFSGKSRRDVFGLIRKTLKLGNPPFFPFQRTRYLSLLREYAPNDYVKELEHTTDEVSHPSAPWGATIDVLSMSGLDSFDEGDLVRYTTGEMDITPPHAFGGIKQPSDVNKVKAPAKAVKAGKVAKASKTVKSPQAPKAVKAPKTVKASKAVKSPKAVKAAKAVKVPKTVKSEKTTPPVRTRDISSGEASRCNTIIRRVSSPKNGSDVQHSPPKTPQAPPTELQERLLSLAERVALKKRIASENEASLKRKPDSGDSGCLQAMSIRVQGENSAIDLDPGERDDTVAQPKVPERGRARRRRQRPVKPLPKNSNYTKAQASRPTGNIIDGGEELLANERNTQSMLLSMVESPEPSAKEANVAILTEEKVEATSTKGKPNEEMQTPAITIRKYEVKSRDGDLPIRRLDSSQQTAKSRTSEVKSLDPDLRFSMKRRQNRRQDNGAPASANEG